MTVQIAMVNQADSPEAPLCIARLATRGRCPVLRAPLHAAVGRLIPGMPLVLVHRDGKGELRTYGDPRHVLTVVGLDLEAQLWADFELPDDRSTSLPSANAA